MAPLPEGWEWLDDMPEEWQAPPELEVPTSYPATNLAILILSCEYIGHDVQAAVGRFLTEQALYMTWFVREVKQSGRRTVKEAALLGDIPHEQARRAYEAWKAFDDVSRLSAPDEASRGRSIDALSALETVLNGSAATLARIRETE